MSEASELQKLEERREKIELKYAKIAKKRLAKINPIISPRKAIIDMSATEFNNYLAELKKKFNA